MIGGWATKTIGELCSEGGGNVQTGPFGSQLKASAYVESGVPTVMPADLIDYRISEERIARIGPEDHARLQRHQLRENDIVYGRRGDIGRHALVTQREVGWLCGTGCLRVRFGDAAVEPSFVSYYLRQASVIDFILSNAVGTTMPNLNTAILESIPITLPPLLEQRAIAHILGTLDDKIELNRRMNQTLEEMARALFKSWFVDFDPVHAKARGEQPPGLDPAIAELFPSGFVETELGLVPEGWRVEAMRQHVTVRKGLSYKGEYLADNGHPLHNLNSVFEGGGYKKEGIKYYTGEFKDRHIVEPGDLIVTNTEQGFDRLLIGYPAMIPNYFGRQGLFTHHLYRVRPRNDSTLSSLYFYFLLRTDVYHQMISGYGNGTTVNMLPQDALERPLVVVPHKEIVDRFYEVAEPIMHKTDLLLVESELLADLCNTLLPKLMSGELRVPEAAEMVEDIAL